MRIAIPAASQFMPSADARNPLAPRLRAFFAAALAAGSLFAAAQQPGTPANPTATKSTAAHKPIHPHWRPYAVHPPTPTPQAAAASAMPGIPKPPDWPANDHPADANVIWNSQGLRVEASNSSLKQILKDVTTDTGVKVEGLGSDLRIFGSYGPGPARVVLAQLLEGSGYNILMIGDQGQGTPREVVLSAHPNGDAPPAPADQSASNDENNDADDQAQQQPQPQPQPQLPPAMMRNGFGPGAVPRTPQQIMEEMQQRQQQQMQQGGSPP